MAKGGQRTLKVYNRRWICKENNPSFVLSIRLLSTFVFDQRLTIGRIRLTLETPIVDRLIFCYFYLALENMLQFTTVKTDILKSMEHLSAFPRSTHSTSSQFLGLLF